MEFSGLFERFPIVHNRIVLALALFGMVLALHLWIQKERDFDQGCWGLGGATEASADTGECQSAELKRMSEFFGVSVAAWGYGFYCFVAGMALAKLVFPARMASACHTASDIAVALAFPYTCYLFYYQAAVAQAFCPLCLVSGGIVALLFALHAFQYGRGGFNEIAPDRRAVELGYAAAMGFGAVAVLGAVLLFVNRVGTRRFDEGSSAKEFSTMVGRSLPEFIDVARLQEMKPVRFDFDVPALKTEHWVGRDTPALGTPGKVSVVVFLDPNCPSCQGTFAMVRALAARYQEEAAFYVFSRVLWEYSLLQTQALELAKSSGKYFDLWELQLENQKRGGLDMTELESLFTKLDLDTTDFAKRLAEMRPAAVALRDRAQAEGINSTPSIYIDGQAVHARSRDEPSLARLIDLTATGTKPASASAK